MKSRKKCSCISRNRVKRELKKYLFVLPGFVGVSFFVLIPFLDVVRRSFFTSLSGVFVGVKNYLTVFLNQAFQLAVTNTARFAAVCLPLLLAGSLLLALVLNSSIRWEKVKYLYLLPMAMPAATVVLVWQLLFCKQGFVNEWLGSHVDYMGTNAAFLILVGSYIWKNLGYTLILWIAGLKAIPEEMLEAARIDGAGRTTCFFRITLPNLKGCMYTITVLSFLNSFKVFREAYLVSGAYPQEKIYLLQHVFNNWYTNLDIDKMAAGAVLTAIVLGGVSMVLQRLWDREA